MGVTGHDTGRQRAVDAPPPDHNIAAALSAVLSSAAFSGSRRCQDFLRWVVTRALAGDFASIKERTIASEVFSRGAGYDPSADAIVRVKATEVRRRLTRYYESEGAAAPVRIELPVGSYIPVFHGLSAGDTVPARSRFSRLRGRSAWIWSAAAAACGLFAGVALPDFGIRSPLHRTEVDQVWSPILREKNPAIVYVPGLRTLAPENWLDRDQQLQPSLVDGFGRGVFKTGELPLYLRENIVGMGDAGAAIEISNYLVSRGKKIIPKMGQDLSFGELGRNATVLIGAFSSRWTLELNRGLRFQLVPGTPNGMIVDSRRTSRRWQVKPVSVTGRLSEDYAIAARILDNKTGQPVYICAGIGTFGNRAAAEFLTDPVHIRKLVARAPAHWRNFQAIIYTRIVNSSNGPPELVDVAFW